MIIIMAIEDRSINVIYKMTYQFKDTEKGEKNMTFNSLNSYVKSLVIILVLTVGLASITLTISRVQSTGSTIGITFNQIDFVFTDVTMYHSDWGRVEVEVDNFTGGQGLYEGYLNIYSDNGWIVQNHLINHVTGMSTITIYFDLGVPAGTNVTWISAHLEFSSNPYTTFTDGTRENFTVSSMKYNAEGAGPLTINVIPTPPPPMPIPKFVPMGETFDFTKPNYPGENVQTACSQCFPMSIANSLQYLENQHGLIVPHNHQPGLKGDNTLVGKLDSACNRNAPNRIAGDGVWFDDMLDGKFKYLSGNGLAGKLIHKHQGYGYGPNPPNGKLPPGPFTRWGITSIDESVGGKVTFEWLCEQLEDCEDVEVVFWYEDAHGNITGGHAVRIFGCGKTLGQPYLRYKHDSLQTDGDPTDTLGLEEPQVYVDDLDGDGMLNFGSIDMEICFALSESVIDEEPPPRCVGGVVDVYNVSASPLWIVLGIIIASVTVTMAHVKKRQTRRNARER